MLLITFTCAHSFSVKFETSPADKLVRGSFSPYHYFDKNDIQLLQEYAVERGVIIVPEIRMPGQTMSWMNAEEELLASCPNLYKKNVNNAVLDPYHKDLSKYL